jgi:hypothetical protein
VSHGNEGIPRDAEPREPSPGTERYWSDLAAAAADGGDDQDDDAEPEPERVEDLIRQQIVDYASGAVDVSALLLTGSTETATFVTVVYREGSTARSGPKLWQRQVAVDADQSVKVTDNAMWVPADSRAPVNALLSGLGRAVNDLGGAVDGDAPPIRESALSEVEPADVLDREVRDDGAPDDGQGRPDALDLLDRRLSEAGIPVEGEEAGRYLMLKFGAKKPFKDHSLRYGSDRIRGNYGIYATRDDPLVLVDIDDPDAFPWSEVDLPPTLTSTSPHGSVGRCHRFYACPDYERVVEEWGDTWNFGAEWGEIRAKNQYVVGPGSALDAEGCDTGDYEYGEPEGCEACSSDDGGRYEIVDNREVGAVDADALLALLDASGDLDADDDGAELAAESVDSGAAESGAEREATDADREAPEVGPDDEAVECCRCGREIPERKAEVVARDGDDVAWGCGGGCP